jgi:hypothetical protein
VLDEASDGRSTLNGTIHRKKSRNVDSVSGNAEATLYILRQSMGPERRVATCRSIFFFPHLPDGPMTNIASRISLDIVSDSTLQEFRIVSDEQEDRSFREAMDARLAGAKKAAKAKRKKPKRIPFATWLRKMVCRLNYGQKYPGTKPTPKLDAETLMRTYRKKRCGAAIDNEQFERHLDSRDTFYFWADHRSSTAAILVMIDIDVHDGIGTSGGAWQFAELVRYLFPDIHLESSTNGEGVHGYLVISKEGISARRIKNVLTNLQVYLRELHRFSGADISCVEIKGGPPEVKFHDLTGDITEIVFGQLAKIPRQPAVMNTCTIEFADLVVFDAADIPTKFSGLAAHDCKVSALARSARCVPTPCSSTSEAAAVPESKKYIGSHDTRIIRQDVLDRLPSLERFAARLLYQWAGETQMKAGRWTVTPADLAQLFAVMMSLQRDDEGFDRRFKGKVGDALPVRQIGNLWQAAFKSGDFTRPFNHHRFKAMRDMLSEHGHIDWIEHRFFNFPEESGKKKRDGWCCKWRLGTLLRGVLDSLKYTPPTSVDTPESIPDGPHEFHAPTFSPSIFWYHERACLTRAEDDIDQFFRSKAA